MEKVLKVRGLNKSYEDKQVLHDLNFEVERGEIVGYIGPNGSGKSTTIKIILSLISDHTGEIEIFGEKIGGDSTDYKRRIGYVPEMSMIYESLTPAEYFSFLSRIYGMDTNDYLDRAQTMLKIFGVEEHIQQRMESFSKGMKQKVSIVSSMLHNPDILFLDEPLNGLDANSVAIFKDVVSSLAKKGKTVFYSSHIMEVVQKVSSRIILLKEGYIIADGTMKDLEEHSEDKSLESIFNQLTGFDEKADLVKEYVDCVLGGHRDE
ncbi:ABC transporter ATP-binding protein [Filifactor villosus]|uniref:ABC transporter ATP-binding protein n=1 Tax=Filifactor villosus TaxID=29374 RepID=A0ABV9QGU8_9FIRM